jgi:hypothetical protein
MKRPEALILLPTSPVLRPCGGSLAADQAHTFRCGGRPLGGAGNPRKQEVTFEVARR